MIFKIQKPLHSINNRTYLICNEDRSIETNSLEIGQIPEIDALFQNEDKIYVKGYVAKNGKDIIINRKVTGQDW